MPADADISGVARAIGEPARAAMLLRLMDGRAHTARDLAAAAAVAPSTASFHLRRLCETGLVTVTEAGRRRLHRLAGAEVAALVEALASVAPPLLPDTLQPVRGSAALRLARACYGHLAGQLGVAVAQRLVEDGVVPALQPGESGHVQGFDHPLLRTLGVRSVAGAPRPAVRACLDWTHRTPHLAGALGTSILAALLHAGWLRHRRTGRALLLTPAGRDGFRRTGLL